MTSIPVGISADEKVIFRKADRDTHLHVIGASGVGKSYFLEHMIRRDISRGNGICLIDPHGETYNNLLQWLACSGYRANELHLINPSENQFSVGFNPLAVDREPTRCVADMINAIVRVWGGNSMTETPRLNKCLRMTLYPLAHHRLSLLESDIFTSTRHKQKRQQLVAELPIEEYRNEWAEFDTYTDKEFREYFESTRSRLFEFITSPAIKPIIGQTQNVLDFGDCMEKGHVVLVNLAEGGSFHKQDGQMLGAMLTADLYSSAKQRDVTRAKGRPFYAYVDECGDYINEDISKSLDETRKYGLHYILSHQRLQQLRNVSDDCYDAVMANAQAKVIFRVNDDDNAEQLCRHLFRSEFNLELPKESLNKPVAVGQEIIDLLSGSETHGSSESETTTESEGFSATIGDSSSDGVSIFTPEEGDIEGETANSSRGESSSSGSSWSTSTSTSTVTTSSQTSGYSQSLKTVYKVMPTAVYSMEELIHMGIRAIRELPQRTAFVSTPNNPPKRIATLEVKTPHAFAGQVDRFVKAIHMKSRYTLANPEIYNQISNRQKNLLGGIEMVDRDYNPDDFMD